MCECDTRKVKMTTECFNTCASVNGSENAIPPVGLVKGSKKSINGIESAINGEFMHAISIDSRDDLQIKQSQSNASSDFIDDSSTESEQSGSKKEMYFTWMICIITLVTTNATSFWFTIVMNTTKMYLFFSSTL